MRKFNESVLSSALSVCLGLIWVGSFVPFGVPAFWLVLALVLAGVAQFKRSEPVTWDWRAPTFRLATAFGIYTLVFALSVAIHAGGARELDKPVRFLVAALAVSCVVQTRLRSDWLALSLVAAAAVALLYAAYARLVLGEERVGMFVNPIQFGVMASVVSLICAMLAIGLPAQGHERLRRLLGLAVVASASAAVLSGSLTAMLPMLSLPFMIFFGWGHARWRKVALAAAVVAIPVMGAVTAAHGPWQDRFTSNESRLENFASAVALFREAPMLGVGRQAFIEKRHEMMRQGTISAYTAGFNVSHSEYFDALAKRGLFGLVGLLILFVVPAGVFLRLARAKAGVPRAWAGAGLATALAFGLASLTQNVITHGSGTNMMAASLVICLALAIQPAPGDAGTLRR